MSRIIFQKSYIVIVPSFEKTANHKHPFLHLFLGENGCKIAADHGDIQGNIILLDSNVKHAVKAENGCNFFLLIDPTSNIRNSFRKNICRIVFITIL